MKKSLQFLFSTVLLSLLFSGTSPAQIGAPTVNGAYGGRVNAITGYTLSPTESRIFITTESANSGFYATYDSTTKKMSPFAILPFLSSAENLGSGIRMIAAHAASGALFFIHDSGLLMGRLGMAHAKVVEAGMIKALLIKGNNLFYIKAEGPGDKLYFGTLDTAAVFTPSAGSPISLSGPVMFASMTYNPANNLLYIASGGNKPKLFKSSDAYSSISGTTTFSSISTAAFDSSKQWNVMGIGPDGRIFIGTAGTLGYIDNETTWNFVPSANGSSQKDLTFQGDSASYSVYYGSAFSTNKGVSGSWHPFGYISSQTHANDGAVFADPNCPNVCYMTTDEGIGMSVNRGASTFEIDEGIEALQVKDISMTPGKTTAWLASKAGIRKVTGYNTSAPVWSLAMFPNSDGSPYYSVQMAPSDSNTIYAGNVRVYKTTDSGATWKMLFDAVDPSGPYHYNNASIEAIEVCPYDESTVFAGYSVFGSDNGGLFCTTDAGSSWQQILINASKPGSDVDVQDIIFNLEGADTVAYVAVGYDKSFPAGKSVYRLTKKGSLWTPVQDMDSSHTISGKSIDASIYDLDKNAAGSVIYACGTDAATNNAVSFYKPVTAANKWAPLPNKGLPIAPGRGASAITSGGGNLFIAVGNEILYMSETIDTVWSPGYVYPNGTEINFLYYDALLAGTGTGLYGHADPHRTTDVKQGARVLPLEYKLMQNYPNPFNPSTAIKYQIPAGSFVTIKIYDQIGREVVTLVNEEKPAGIHTAYWNGRSSRGASVSSGIYFYRITAGNYAETKKMDLIK